MNATRIVIEVYGGMVSKVIADHDYEAVVIDYDTEGSGDESEDERIKAVGPDGELAGVTIWEGSGTEGRSEVDAMFERVDAAYPAEEAS